MTTIKLYNTYTKGFSKDTIRAVEKRYGVTIQEERISYKQLGDKTFGDGDIVYWNVRHIMPHTYKSVRKSIKDIYVEDGQIFLTAFNKRRYLRRAVKKAVRQLR